MVKVIDKTPHPSVVKQKICSHCGVTLEYVPKDIKQRTVSDYTGERDIVHYIACPECNHQVTVKSY